MLGVISFVAVIVLALAVLRQQRRLKTLESELAGLRKALPPSGEARESRTDEDVTAATLPEAAVAAVLAERAHEPDKAVAPEPATEAETEAATPDTILEAAPTHANKPDIETALGTRWAVWVGGIALALGGIFLVRYSIEAGIFGPRVRLALAGMLGLALAASGEFIRRTGFRVPVEGMQHAYVPGILTAAGAFTLFGTIYAAHGIYGFIGSGTAFALLGLIGIGTVAAALLHGQAIAGLGLLGSYLTPLLVASEAPNHWALFVFLAIVLTSTAAIARLRDWTALMAAAFAGTGIWTLVYLLTVPQAVLSIVIFINAVTLGALVFVWLRGRETTSEASIDIDLATIAPAIFVALGALLLFCVPSLRETGGIAVSAASIAALLAAAFYRRLALAALFGAGVATVLNYAYVALGGAIDMQLFAGGFAIEQSILAMFGGGAIRYGIALGAAFVLAGIWQAYRFAPFDRIRAGIWMAFAVVVPLIVLAALWFAFGNLDRDYRYALVALLLVAIFAAAAELLGRGEGPWEAGGPATSIGIGGATAGALLAIHWAFGGGMTTVLAGALIGVPALVTALRPYSALGWSSVAVAAVVLGRIAFDPTIVGSEFLGRTPVFNWLLPGYAIPALFSVYAAWQLTRTTGGRPRMAMEAFASLFALVGLAMLVRHAMNGGIVDGDAPTLAEQSIYTLITLGGGAVLIALDLRSPSPVFRYGSLTLGVLSVAFIVLQHFANLNPLRTDESTGGIPVINLLLLGYLLPGLAMGALAWYARNTRPRWYVAMLAVVASLLGFAYATLSVRRLFHGEFIGLWKGLSQLETYSYSALWLGLGVALLILGVRLNSHILRIASASLVVVAVAKVFLFDMSELEGVLRALSFIGLGAVLIGIGLFYQRMLASVAK